MSAIWGYIDFNNEACSVASMAYEYKRKCRLDSIKEQPFKNALFGHGLQIINDEDEYEQLPYILDDGETIITADCILDNREDLISQLCVGVDKSRIPDGKLISLAYEKWYYDFPKHLKGLFSIAIYNHKMKELFLCTDQTASRCLYYYKDEQKYIFSTLLSPMLQVQQDLVSNEKYIKDYLALPGLLPVLSPVDTPYEDVYMVEAGNYILFDLQTSSKKCVRYYTPQNIKVSGGINKAKEQFLKVYSDAVRVACRTKGKVALTLSGGFDSTSVAVLAAKELADQNKTLTSYTYVPFYKEVAKEKKAFQITDETQLVMKTVERYPNIVPNFEDDGGKNILENMEEVIDVLEIPYKAVVNMATLLRIYKKAADSGHKIVLNGQYGNSTVSYGDINVALYHLYCHNNYAKYIQYFSSYCKLSGLSRKQSFFPLLKAFKYAKDHDNKYAGYTQQDLSNPFVKKEILEEYGLTKADEYYNLLSSANILKSHADYSKEVFYPALLNYMGEIETKLSLYTGAIIRDPTKDINIFSYCLAIPYEYFCYKGIPRYLIRGFMKDLIPEDILYPIKRKGVQNADWLMRLNKDFEEVKHQLLVEMEKGKIKEYVDEKKWDYFIKGQTDISREMESEYLHSFVLYNLSKTLKLLQFS